MKKKVKEIFKNKFNVLLISIVAIFTIYYAGFIANKLSGVRCFYNTSDSVSYIDISTPKTFSLPVKTDNLSAIQFPFIIENTELSDDDLKKIKFDINIEGVKNLYFTTDVLSNAAGEHFLKIFLAPRVHNKNNKDLNVTVSCAEGVSFLKNDDDNIIYKLNGLKKIVITGAVILFILFIAFCYFIIYVTRKWKLENRFLLYALVLGVGYIFVRAPLTNYDEICHYDTAYNMSNIILGYGDKNSNGTLLKRKCDLNLLPDFYPKYYDLGCQGFSRNGGKAFYKHLLLECKKDVDEELVPSIPNKALNNQRAYIFSALAVSVARLLHFNQFGVYYSGCIFNLIISLSFIYLSIKLNNKYQYIFASIPFIPLYIIDLGSFSYDSITISFSFLVISLALYIYEVHRKNYIAWSLFIVISLFLFPIKVVYFIVPFFLFFLLFYSSNVKRKRFITILCVLIGYSISFLLAKSGKLSFLESRSISGANDIISYYTYSLSDVITHPVSFFSLIISHIVEFSFSQFVDYFPLNIPVFIKYVFTFSIILLGFSKNRDCDKTVIISSFFVFIFLFILLCLVGIVWTNYGEFSLWGIQLRYFLPVMPLLFIALRNLNCINFYVDENISFNLLFIGSLFFLINLFVQTVFWVAYIEK